MEAVIVRVGSDVPIQHRTSLERAMQQVRTKLAKEMQIFMPTVVLKKDDNLRPNEYEISLNSFGRVLYEIETWDLHQETTPFTTRLLFHYERFLRKWMTNAPDIGPEEYAKTVPFLLEYGVDWAEVVENEPFFYALQSLLASYGMDVVEPPYWESDYVGNTQCVVYICGKEHYLLPHIACEKQALLKKGIEPILQSNRLRLQKNDSYS